MASGTPNYAEDPSSAEKGPPENQANKSREAPWLINPPPHNPYAEYSRPHSKVWSLYLDETEAEDKELIQLWKTGLDSLLAGLFAGVLAAFLLESRRGLQEDLQLVLLREINQVLRNESSRSALSFQPSTSSVSINFLWFISLTLTLVSALSAVLAKGWIDAYLPASAGKASGDACERHLRAIRAYQWHMDGVLAAIPLLLQLSLLLFLAGLVIFVLGDSKSIGAALLALITMTIVLYTVVTFLPRLSPACPFRTTLSTFIPGTDKTARYKQNDRSSYKLLSSSGTSVVSKVISDFGSKPEETTVEVMILAWILANSTREDAKDEAFKAIIGLDSYRSDDLRSAMREYSAIPGLCTQLNTACELFHGCDDKIVGERTTMTEASKQSEFVKAIKKVVPHIVDALMNSSPWVRSHAVVALGKLSRQPELVKAIESVVPRIADALKDTDPWVRNSALDALGVISKQSELVKAVEIVVPRIADVLKDTDPDVCHSALSALGEISKQSEFVKAIERVVPRIADALKNTNPNVCNSALRTLGEISKQSELVKAIESVMPHIADTLKDTNPWVRNSALRVLGEISKQPELVKPIESVVPRIADALKDTESDVRDSALRALGEISKLPELTKAIESVVPHIADALNDTTFLVRGSALGALGEISKLPELVKAVEIVVPHIADALKDTSFWVRDSALRALGEISKQPELVKPIEWVMPHIVDLLKHPRFWVHFCALRALGEISKQSELVKALESLVPHIADALKDTDSDVRDSALRALGKISEQPELVDAIENVVPHIADALKATDSDVCGSALSALGEISKLSQLIKEMESAVPEPS